MKFQLKKNKDCKRQFRIEIGADRIETLFGEILKEIQKKATLKGFREGRAPLELIEKQFSETANEEVIRTLVSEAYASCLESSRLVPVGSPEVHDLKMERKKNLTFTLDVEVAPEISIKSYKGLKVKRFPEEVTPADVEKVLAELRDTRAELEPTTLIRPVMEGDFLVCDTETYKEGAYVPGEQGVLLAVDSQRLSPDILKELVGAQVGDVREIRRDPTPAEKEKGMVGAMPFAKVHVRGIKTKKLPELNDALAAGFGKKTLDEMRAEIRESLEAQKRTEAREHMKTQIYETLLKNHEIELPAGLVERQKKRLIDDATAGRNGAPAHEAQQNGKLDADALERARRQVKLYFLLEKIAEVEHIEPKEEDVSERIRVIAERSGRSEEEIRKGFAEDIRHQLKQSLVGEFLLSNASPVG